MPARPKEARQPYTAAEQEMIVTPLAALGEPNRLKIMFRLLEGPCTISELVPAVKCAMPTVSSHNKILKAAGLITSRREGKYSYVMIKDGFPRELMALVHQRMREQAAARALALQ